MNSKDKAIKEFEAFIAGGDYLISLLSKNPGGKRSAWEKIKKIDSQAYFKQFMKKVIFAFLLNFGGRPKF